MQPARAQFHLVSHFTGSAAVLMAVSPEGSARIRTVHLPISWAFCLGYISRLQMLSNKAADTIPWAVLSRSAGNSQLRTHCNRLAQGMIHLHSKPSLHPWTMPCVLHVPHHTFSYWPPSVLGIPDCWVVYLLTMLSSPSAYQSCMWILNSIFLFQHFRGQLSTSQNLWRGSNSMQSIYASQPGASSELHYE